MIELLAVDPRRDRAWRELVATSRAGVFGSSAWFSAIAATYGFEMSANVILDEGRPIAGLAFSELNDFLGHRLLSMPFCDYLDPVVEQDEHWKELVDPLLARKLPMKLRVLDAKEPRRDHRFVQVAESQRPKSWRASGGLGDATPLSVRSSRTGPRSKSDHSRSARAQDSRSCARPRSRRWGDGRPLTMPLL